MISELTAADSRELMAAWDLVLLRTVPSPLPHLGYPFVLSLALAQKRVGEKKLVFSLKLQRDLLQKAELVGREDLNKPLLNSSHLVFLNARLCHHFQKVAWQAQPGCDSM